MAALVAAIHDFAAATKDVDARHEAGHDGSVVAAMASTAILPV
jgi:hypothetical protein